MTRMQQELQVKEGRWLEQRWRQPKGEDRTDHEYRGKFSEVHLAKWISVEDRDEVHEQIQRKVRYLLQG